jgi:hypothetical protein
MTAAADWRIRFEERLAALERHRERNTWTPEKLKAFYEAFEAFAAFRHDVPAVDAALRAYDRYQAARPPV